MNGSTLVKISEDVLKDKEKLAHDLQVSGATLCVQVDQVKSNLERFTSEIKSFGQSSGSLGDMKTINEAAGKIFNLWKVLRKTKKIIYKDVSKSSISELLKLAKGDRISRMVNMDRKAMILTGSELLKENYNLTVILANKTGDIIVMSNREDCVSIIKDLAKKAGGNGGGNKEFAQGKVNPEKLKELL